MLPGTRTQRPSCPPQREGRMRITTPHARWRTVHESENASRGVGAVTRNVGKPSPGYCCNRQERQRLAESGSSAAWVKCGSAPVVAPAPRPAARSARSAYGSECRRTPARGVFSRYGSVRPQPAGSGGVRAFRMFSAQRQTRTFKCCRAEKDCALPRKVVTR